MMRLLISGHCFSGVGWGMMDVLFGSTRRERIMEAVQEWRKLVMVGSFWWLLVGQNSKGESERLGDFYRGEGAGVYWQRGSGSDGHERLTSFHGHRSRAVSARYSREDGFFPPVAGRPDPCRRQGWNSRSDSPGQALSEPQGHRVCSTLCRGALAMVSSNDEEARVRMCTREALFSVLRTSHESVCKRLPRYKRTVGTAGPLEETQYSIIAIFLQINVFLIRIQVTRSSTASTGEFGAVARLPKYTSGPFSHLSPRNRPRSPRHMEDLLPIAADQGPTTSDFPIV